MWPGLRNAGRITTHGSSRPAGKSQKQMKVTDYFANAQGQTLVSFEILPPLKGGGMSAIFETLDPLMEFKPPFIDVTYHREEFVYKKMPSGY